MRIPSLLHPRLLSTALLVLLSSCSDEAGAPATSGGAGNLAAGGASGSGGGNSPGADASMGAAGSDVSVTNDAGGESAVEAGPPPPPGGPDVSIPADPGPQPFLHPLFTDHVVLQRDALTPVWGWSAAGDKITVKIANHTYTATADQYGRWLVRIGPFASDPGPNTLEVSGPQTTTIQDVQFGDVWLCSGQSNMEFTVNGSINAAAEAAASANPNLRLFTVRRANLKEPRQTFLEPDPKNPSKWTIAGPQTVPGFSAVCYFMARELSKQLKGVPLGLIHSSWGGTSIEWWTSAEKLGTIEDFRHPLDMLPAQTIMPTAPVITSLYNGMIAPLLPFGLKGIAWYQGENNGGNGWQYSRLLPAMIDDWRTRFRMGKLSFINVQLANYNNGHMPMLVETGGGWPVLREAQLLTRRSDEKEGMGVIVDVGNPDNIHPTDKQDVGFRLATSALHVAYGQDNVFEGPLFKSFAVEGDKIRVTFDTVGSGLMVGTKNFATLDPVQEVAAGQLSGFAIAGADKKWAAATATIDAATKTVVVSAASVPVPVAVRYGWADNPTCNLYNKEGLMASPFRTDPDYRLSVIDGSGGNIYPAGQKVPVQAAAAPGGMHFLKWVGDVQALADPNGAQTTITMPSQYVSIRATYGN